MTNLNGLIEQYNAAMEAVRKDGKEAMYAEVKELFRLNPTLTSVRWYQYTPYFNDGEPCTFRVSAWGGLLNASEDDYHGEPGYTTSDGQEIVAADNFLDQVNNLPEALLEGVFGDHVTVTCTPDGIATEEYDHD